MKYLRAFLKKLIELIDKELADQKRITNEQSQQLARLNNQVDVLSRVILNQDEKMRKMRFAIDSQKEKIRFLREQIKSVKNI